MPSSKRRVTRWLNPTTLTLLTAVALLLALADLSLVLMSRTARRELDENRRFIDQTEQLNRDYQNLVRQIARAAVEEKDETLRELLTRRDIRIETVPAASAAAPAPGAEPAAAPSTAGTASQPAPAGAAAAPAQAAPTQAAGPPPTEPGPLQRFTIRFDDRFAALTPPSIPVLDAAVAAARAGGAVRIEIEGCPANAGSPSNLCARRTLSMARLLMQRGIPDPERLLAGPR